MTTRITLNWPVIRIKGGLASCWFDLYQFSMFLIPVSCSLTCLPYEDLIESEKRVNFNTTSLV